MKFCRTKAAFSVACLFCTALVQADTAGSPDIMQTPSGIRFGVLGTKGSSPAPTLFVFATDIENSLTSRTYNSIGFILRQHGYLCVSLDLPYHPSGGGLDGWATATQNNEAWVSDFVSEVSQVLDYLIKKGYTDPQKVAVAGTSRGGFMAMHVAAADPRIRCAIGFVPVTDLTQLTEFANLKDDQLAKSLSLTNVAEKLVGRSVWVGIGNNDERVNTDKAIEFTRKVVAASVADGKASASTEFIDVELHVMPWPGHGGNELPAAHDAAAAWLLTRMAAGPPK